jgi:hypothetical protein
MICSCEFDSNPKASIMMFKIMIDVVAIGMRDICMIIK